MNRTGRAKCGELAYQCAFGKNKSQYRNAAHLFGSKQTVDYMPVDDLIKLTKSQEQVAVMLQMGLDYAQMKVRLLSLAEAPVNPPGEKRRRSLWKFIADRIRPFLYCQGCNQKSDAA